MINLLLLESVDICFNSQFYYVFEYSIKHINSYQYLLKNEEDILNNSLSLNS